MYRLEKRMKKEEAGRASFSLSALLMSVPLLQPPPKEEEGDSQQ
jgi:hypothetical protein